MASHDVAIVVCRALVRDEDILLAFIVGCREAGP
jgi:hypothetical protein